MPTRFIWVINAFNMMASVRPQPIQRLTLREISEYMEIYPVSDKDLFVRLIMAIDETWFNYTATKKAPNS